MTKKERAEFLNPSSKPSSEQVQNNKDLVLHMKSTGADPKLIELWEQRIRNCTPPSGYIVKVSDAPPGYYLGRQFDMVQREEAGVWIDKDSAIAATEEVSGDIDEFNYCRVQAVTDSGDETVWAEQIPVPYVDEPI